MNLGGFTGGSQLLQVTVAEFSLFVFLVANGLRVGDPLGTATVSVADMLERIVHESVLLVLSVAVFRISSARSGDTAVANASLEHALTHTRFTVTAGAVIFNDKGEGAAFETPLSAAGSGWGLPRRFSWRLANSRSTLCDVSCAKRSDWNWTDVKCSQRARFKKPEAGSKYLFRARANARRQIADDRSLSACRRWFRDRRFTGRFAARPAKLHRQCCENRAEMMYAAHRKSPANKTGEPHGRADPSQDAVMRF
jgi:hypothetical protein